MDGCKRSPIAVDHPDGAPLIRRPDGTGRRNPREGVTLKIPLHGPAPREGGLRGHRRRPPGQSGGARPTRKQRVRPCRSAWIRSMVCRRVRPSTAPIPTGTRLCRTRTVRREARPPPEIVPLGCLRVRGAGPLSVLRRSACACDIALMNAGKASRTVMSVGAFVAPSNVSP